MQVYQPSGSPETQTYIENICNVDESAWKYHAESDTSFVSIPTGKESRDKFATHDQLEHCCHRLGSNVGILRMESEAQVEFVKENFHDELRKGELE